MKFEIALETAEKAGLVLSSRCWLRDALLRGELPDYPVSGAPTRLGG